MKRIFAVLLTVLLLLTLAACALCEAVPAQNAFAEYDGKGYEHGVVTVLGDENGLVLQVYFNSPDRTDCALIEAQLTEEENAALQALDFFDEHFDENEWALVTALPADRVTVTSLNDRIPTEEELKRYENTTAQALLDDGYFWYTEEYDENGKTFLVFLNYDNCVKLSVTPAKENVEPEDLSDEQLGSLPVGKVVFRGFEGG